jgi:hypothetical protein
MVKELHYGKMSGILNTTKNIRNIIQITLDNIYK